MPWLRMRDWAELSGSREGDVEAGPRGQRNRREFVTVRPSNLPIRIQVPLSTVLQQLGIMAGGLDPFVKVRWLREETAAEGDFSAGGELDWGRRS